MPLSYFPAWVQFAHLASPISLSWALLQFWAAATALSPAAERFGSKQLEAECLPFWLGFATAVANVAFQTLLEATENQKVWLNYGRDEELLANSDGHGVEGKHSLQRLRNSHISVLNYAKYQSAITSVDFDVLMVFH